MKCPNCQSEVPEASKFCAHCGRRLTAAPPAAGWQRPVLLSAAGLFVVIIAVFILRGLFTGSDSGPGAMQNDTASTAAVETQESSLPTTTASSAVSNAPVATLIVTEPAAPTATPEQVETGPQLLWTVEADNFALVDDTAFVQLANSIQAVDIETGSVLWATELNGGIVAADTENLYLIPALVPASQRLDAVSIQTGELVWTAFLEQEIETSLFGVRVRTTSRSVLVDLENGHSARIDKETGETVTLPYRFERVVDDVAILATRDAGIQGWSLDLQEMIWSVGSGGIEGVCNNLLIISREDRLEAVEVETGSTLWQVQDDNPYSDDLYCGSSNNNAADVFSLSDLVAELFSHEVPVDNSEHIYLAGTSEYHRLLTAIDQTTGQIFWNGLPSYTPSSAFGQDLAEFYWLGAVGGQILYTHVNFGQTRAYDAQTHQLLWENNQVTLFSVLGIVDQTIIGRVWNRWQSTQFVGLDLETGTRKWTYESGPIESAVIVDDLIVYEPDANYGPLLQFLDPESGTPVGEFDLQRGSTYLIPFGQFVIVNHSDYLSAVKP